MKRKSNIFTPIFAKFTLYYMEAFKIVRFYLFVWGSFKKNKNPKNKKNVSPRPFISLTSWSPYGTVHKDTNQLRSGSW